MAFKFVVDRIIKGRAYPALAGVGSCSGLTRTTAYPALAQWEARPYTSAWRQFGSHWPWTTPLRLEEYCRQHQYPIDLFTLDNHPDRCWYPICLGFFDFEIDYLSLLPPTCKSQLKSRHLRLLFMYHEGDNPLRIKSRLDALCQAHGLTTDCYSFISSNTSADRLPRYVCFHDFELWYHQRNINTAPLPLYTNRDCEFLCLNRVHKSWRASVMADLLDSKVLTDSMWSYCAVDINDDLSDNPIQVDLVPQLRYRTQKFLEHTPYYTDNLTDEQRNDHSIFAEDLFRRCYANIVIESQFDVDQSGGAFLTEKTFKPIKHGQMFFVIGASGSLTALKNLGYKVFDHVLDTRYDLIEDHTQRWLAAKEAIQQAQQQGLAELYQQCLPDLNHNQQLFLSAPWQRLNTLCNILEQHYDNS